jgi:hypothetical protein
MFPFAVVKPTRETATVASAGGANVTATGSAVLATLYVPAGETWELLEWSGGGAVADEVELGTMDADGGAVTVLNNYFHGANGGFKDVVTVPQLHRLTTAAGAADANRKRFVLTNKVAASGNAVGKIVARRVS